jgi:hypothetical protein
MVLSSTGSGAVFDGGKCVVAVSDFSLWWGLIIFFLLFFFAICIFNVRKCKQNLHDTNIFSLLKICSLEKQKIYCTYGVHRMHVHMYIN